MGIRRTAERFCSGPPGKVIEGTRARPKNEPSCGLCVRPYVDSAAHSLFRYGHPLVAVVTTPRGRLWPQLIPSSQVGLNAKSRS